MALGRRILVIGHRGTQPYFENTIESFKAAEKEHADAVETDVRQTKDGHCVLFHDKKLNRIFRWNVKLRKLSFKAAKKLRIPSVPELLTNIKIPINFEIKERSAVRHILPLIKKYGREKDVIISYRCINLLWRPIGQLMRIVLVNHPVRGKIILITTMLDIDPLKVISTYGYRFIIEVSFNKRLIL